MSLLSNIANIYDASERREIARQQLAEEIAGREASDIREQAKIDLAQEAHNSLAEKMAGEASIAQAELQPKLDLWKAQAGQANRSPSARGSSGSGLSPEALSMKGAIAEMGQLESSLRSQYTPEEDLPAIRARRDSLRAYVDSVQRGGKVPESAAVIPEVRRGAFGSFMSGLGEGVAGASQGLLGLAGRMASGPTPASAPSAQAPAPTSSPTGYKEGDISKSGKFIVRSGQWVKR